MQPLLRYVNKKLIQKGADDIVLVLEKKKNNQIKFTNNNITSINSWSENIISVFCSIKKKIVVSNLEDFSKKGVNDLIKNIFNFQRTIKPKEDYYGIAKGPFNYKKIERTYDKKIINLGDNAVDLVEDGINTALNHGADRSSGLLEFGNFEIFLLTSNNVEANDKGTNIYYSIRVFNKDGSGHKVGCDRFLKNLKLELISKEAAITAKESRNPKHVLPGKYDIIFDVMPFANLLNHVTISSSIAAVESGLSFFINKLNKKVANNNFTLIDNGALQNGYNSVKFDHEGVPTKKNIIIDKGILKTYLCNTSYAKKYNTKTTANAGLIDPHPFNIILKKGNYNKEELIKEVKKGLYVTNTWYTRFQDYVKGDFSTMPRDAVFFIENGKIKHSVKDIRVSDNLLNILKNIRCIGNKTEQVIGWEIEIPTITPTVLAKNINITRSTA